MTWQADLQICTYVDSYASDTVLAVGWLEDDHPYPTGDVSDAFMHRLHEVVVHAQYYMPIARLGIHRCSLCPPRSVGEKQATETRTWVYQPEGSATYWIPTAEALYIIPQLIFHYIKDHRYLPPQPFIDAIANCPLPGTQESLDLFVQHLPESKRPILNFWRERWRQRDAARQADSYSAA